MFVRTKTFKNKDGSIREYLFICETRREGNKVRQITLANLGRLDSIDTQRTIDNLIDSLAKFSKKRAILNLSKGLFADWAKLYGPVLVFKALWQKTGLKRIISEYAKERKFEFDLSSVIFSMVLGRLLDPLSKLSTQKWLKREVYDEEIDGLRLEHLYRSLDFLKENAENIEDSLYREDLNLFNQGVDLFFFDTTSIKFYGEENSLMKKGHSKDKRPDLNQVVVGIVLRRDGKPISHHIFPGNTVDVVAFKEMITSIKKRFRINRVVFVVDRGMISRENIRLLDELGLEYIIGVKLRQKKEVKEDVVSRAGRYKEVSKNLFVKEVFLGKKRYIVCLNPIEQIRDSLKRDEIIKRLKEKLKKDPKSLIKNHAYRGLIKIERDSIKINEEKIKEEERYDGKYVLTTNTNLSAEDVATAYRGLFRIERVFRELKSYLEIQPIYHYAERRIEAHIFLCFLALLLEWELARRLKEIDDKISVHEVIDDLCQVKIVKLRYEETEFLVRTELKGKAYLAFKAVGIRVPPRVIELNVVPTSSSTLKNAHKQ